MWPSYRTQCCMLSVTGELNDNYCLYFSSVAAFHFNLKIIEAASYIPIGKSGKKYEMTNQLSNCFRPSTFYFVPRINKLGAPQKSGKHFTVRVQYFILAAWKSTFKSFVMPIWWQFINYMCTLWTSSSSLCISNGLGSRNCQLDLCSWYQSANPRHMNWLLGHDARWNYSNKNYARNSPMTSLTIDACVWLLFSQFPMNGVKLFKRVKFKRGFSHHCLKFISLKSLTIEKLPVTSIKTWVLYGLDLG